MAKRPSKYSYAGKRLPFGAKMPKAKAWRLTPAKSGTILKGTLVTTFKVGGETLALFKVRRAAKSET